MAIESFYLPKEALNYVNYPELRTYKTDIENILEYALRVNSALADYNEDRYDKIDLNTDEIQANVKLCRRVCKALGEADRVAFDVLLELRTIQENFQNLLYLKRKYGNKYIGTPTSEDSGVI